MGTIAGLNKKLHTVDFDSLITDSIEYTKDEIAVLNRSQLLQGYMSTGEQISPQYASPIYALEKSAMNPLPGFLTPDLRLTGSFYQGIGVVVNAKENTFTVSSSDIKAPRLELKYSSAIYGLTKQNKSFYALETLKPVFFEKLHSATGL